MWWSGFVFGFLAGLYFCAWDFAIAQVVRDHLRKRRATQGEGR